MQAADLLNSLTACWPRLAAPCGQWLSQRLHLAEEVQIEGRRFQIVSQVCAAVVHDVPELLLLATVHSIPAGDCT